MHKTLAVLALGSAFLAGCGANKDEPAVETETPSPAVETTAPAPGDEAVVPADEPAPAISDTLPTTEEPPPPEPAPPPGG
jgi:hypothetical protein